MKRINYTYQTRLLRQVSRKKTMYHDVKTIEESSINNFKSKTIAKPRQLLNTKLVMQKWSRENRRGNKDTQITIAK